jgi:DNA-binding SARP family transcriptional activator
MAPDFRVLGPVEATVGGKPVSVGGQPLTLLAGLLVRANSTVSTDLIEYWLWDGDNSAPRRAKGAIQTYVARLRQALGADVVRTVAGGYLLNADQTSLDLLRFEALIARGTAAETAGDLTAAADLLTDALELWRGPALTGVTSDALHRDEVPRLSERRLDAWQLLADVRLALGDPPVAELQRLTREHPLRERFAEQLVLGLFRAGRPADALAAYRQAAAALAEETGLDPGPALRSLHERVLAGDPGLDLPTRAPDAVGWVAPHQLPHDVAGFTGRDAELAGLLADRPAGRAVVAVEGTAGVGKSALAVHAAHRLAADYPDGQVYLNLRGYGPGAPRDRRSSLELLLGSVGVGPDRMPPDTTAREALWRTRTAGRRMLVVLDNARCTTQVRPLLPGAGSLVLVTSRAELRGLVAREGARRLSLARLTPGEARDLLAEAVGRERVAADPAGSEDFLRRCAYLPLAIRILGERASRYPDLSLTEFVSEVDAEGDGLARFDLTDDEETDLRAVFAPSYLALTDAAARLFRLLGAHPGPEFGLPVAAALLSVPPADARVLLGELVRAHLLEQRRPGRYEFHDLLREYATELLRAAPEGADADKRVLTWYVGAAVAAFVRLPPPASLAGIEVPPAVEIADQAEATAWFDHEWTNLVAAVRHAYATGHDRRAWQLTRTTQPYLLNGTHLADARTVHEIGLAAARRLEDGLAEGYMLNGLGVLQSRLREDDGAVSSFEQGLVVARRIGDRVSQRAMLTNLVIAYQRVGRHLAALRAGKQAVVIARETGLPAHQANVLNNIAEVYLELGKYTEAAQHASESHALTGEGGSLRCLGRAYAGLGDHATGAHHLERAAARYRELDRRYDAADSLRLLGEVRLSAGDRAGARDAWQQALAEFERQGHLDAGRVREHLADLDSLRTATG